jgi:hypothetical protein
MRPDCPLWDEVQEAAISAKRLSASMRRLRRSMRHCQVCSEREECPVLIQFNQSFHEALQEVMEEWGLDKP